MARLAAVRRREPSREGWCILRTNGKRTLALAAELTEGGIEAWTPKEIRRRRVPRTRNFTESEQPILSTFVFARAGHVEDLLRILRQPNHPFPPFSIFQYDGRVPIVADHEIANLQALEEKARLARLKTAKHQIAVGTAYSPTEGAFAGLDGVVEKVNGKTAEVCFNGGFRVKVATWLIVDDRLNDTSSPQGTAALAA